MPDDERGCLSVDPMLQAVILAAGKSTRMKSSLPKPLHQICGKPMIEHVISACKAVGVSQPILVIGHEAERVRKVLGEDHAYALQDQQLGSGHAVQCAAGSLSLQGEVLILAGDAPLLTAHSLQSLVERHRELGASLTLLTANMDDPTGYGRIVRNAAGQVKGIVEHRDCSPDQLSIREVNPSIYCFNVAELVPLLDEIKPENSQGEYYLTDAVKLLVAKGKRVEAIPLIDPDEARGINNRIELAEAAAILNQRTLRRLMLSGVTVMDPASTYVDTHVEVGMDTVIHPNTHLQGDTCIGERCNIGPNSLIRRSVIGDDCSVVMSQVEASELGNRVRVGPFANLRAHSILADDVKIGDFVEVKKSVLGEGVSASHLAYIGDSKVGAKTNIGAGVVTCNYDGKEKHTTEIGEKAFVGTNSTLVAPVKIGDGAFVAAGSIINRDVPEDALAIGRAEQTNKPDWAKRRRERWERDHGSRGK